MVGSALAKQRQFKWLMFAAGIALVSFFALVSIVPPMIDRQMPESWYWPEQRAADILKRDRWAAGERLLDVSDAERWSKVKAALQSPEDKSAEVGEVAKPEAGRGKTKGAGSRERRRSK